MQESTKKEKILKKVRNALINKSDDLAVGVDTGKSIYPYNDDILEMIFAENFTAVNGKFKFLESLEEFVFDFKNICKLHNEEFPFCADDKIISLFNDEIKFDKDFSKSLKPRIALTLCESLSARTGSIFVSSLLKSGRRGFVSADIHIVLAFSSQIMPDIKESIAFLRKNHNGALPSYISMITGPSKTADIEKTLILGAHGPKEIYLFLLDNRS
jgi:L-lactate dehydrogenase complex protein LldG